VLNIDALCDATPVEVREMITTLRRSHVSRFPVDVVCEPDRPHVVRFVDSRFPTTRNKVDSCLAILDCSDYDGDGRRVYKVTSRMIVNEKYASHNPQFRVKATTDTKKVIKMLRDYAKPYSAVEVARKFRDGEPSTDYELWMQAPRDQFNNLVHKMHSTDIAEEIIYLRSVGVQFRSEKFNNVASSGIELYEESKRRREAQAVIMLVYTQPDNSVIVTTSSEVDESKMPAGSWTYTSLEEAPPCVQQQVAMLRMCESQVYIPEVGRKVKDTAFWVQVNPEDFKAQNS
jgi:hypothetical protein